MPTRRPSEQDRKFVIRCTAAVAFYVNQTTSLSSLNGQKLSILMIRNANLTPNIMNFVVFQLASTSSQECEEASVDLMIFRKILKSLCNLAENPNNRLFELDAVSLKQI